MSYETSKSDMFDVWSCQRAEHVLDSMEALKTYCHDAYAEALERKVQTYDKPP